MAPGGRSKPTFKFHAKTVLEHGHCFKFVNRFFSSPNPTRKNQNCKGNHKDAKSNDNRNY
jgi:hypothetical protein